MIAVIVVPCVIGCVTLLALIAGLLMAFGGREVERLEAEPEPAAQLVPPVGPVEDLDHHWARIDRICSPPPGGYLSPTLAAGIRRLEDFANAKENH